MDITSSRERTILATGVVAAIVVRLLFVNFESGDYLQFLHPWYLFIQAHGAFHAFGTRFFNYSPLYLHLLSLTTALPIRDLYVIKTWSILADFIGAYFAYRIVQRSYPRSPRPAICSVAVLLIPTVVLNSAAWGQCDMMICALVLGAFYYLLEQRYHLSFILLGVAMALKPQAFFVLPVFALCWWRGQFALGFFAYLPGVYLLTIVPSYLAGRHLKELLLIYYGNATGHYLVANIPNLFALLPSAMDHFVFWNRAGLLLAAAAIAATFLVVHRRTRGRALSDEFMVRLLLFSALAAPFFLPQMHDRYYFLADVIAVLYCFFAPSHVLVPLAIVTASLLAYLDYLFGLRPLGFAVPSVGVAVALAYLCVELIREAGRGSPAEGRLAPASS
jgi:Gpi18-like mannosyltransferase